MKQSHSGGFSLMELMTVVVIISLLGTMASPSFGKYMLKVKSVEAINQIRKIYDAEVARYYKHSTMFDRDGHPIFVPFAPPGDCNYTTGPSCWSFTYSIATRAGSPAWIKQLPALQVS